MAPRTPYAGAVGDRGVAFKAVEHPATDSVFVISSTPLLTDPSRRVIEPENRPGGVQTCTHLPFLAPSETIEDTDLRRLMDRYNVSPLHDATPCLFAMAGSIQNRLEAAARRSLKAYQRLLENLLGMADVIEQRTKAPYVLGLDPTPRQALPADTLRIWPFSERQHWADDLAALKAGRAEMGAPAARAPVSRPPDLAQGQAMVDRALLNVEGQVRAVALSGGWLDRVPLVKSALGDLIAVTPKKVAQQTGVKVDRRFEDDSVRSHLELLLYHGPYTVLLDANGLPTRYHGAVDGPMLIGEHGDPVWRQIQTPGLSFSLYRRGFGDFRISKGKISKILFGGIGGLIHKKVDVRIHDYQKAIQANLMLRGSSASYVAALVSPSAVVTTPLTIRRMIDAYPRFEATVLPYVAAEVIKRLKSSYENWEKVAAEIGKEILLGVIEERIRAKVVDFLEKTVLKKLVPLVNLAFALKDAVDGGPDRRRVRLMIHCLIFHTQGDGKGDTHIASLIMSELVVEHLKDALIEAVVEKLSSRRLGDSDRTVGKADDLAPATKPAPGNAVAPPATSAPRSTPPLDTPANPRSVDHAAPTPLQSPPPRNPAPTSNGPPAGSATAARGAGTPATDTPLSGAPSSGAPRTGEVGARDRSVGDRANDARLGAHEKPAQAEREPAAPKAATPPDTAERAPPPKPADAGDQGGEPVPKARHAPKAADDQKSPSASDPADGGRERQPSNRADRDAAPQADGRGKPTEADQGRGAGEPGEFSRRARDEAPRGETHDTPQPGRPPDDGAPFDAKARDQARGAGAHEKPVGAQADSVGKDGKPTDTNERRAVDDSDHRGTKAKGLPPPPPRGKSQIYDAIILHADDPALQVLKDKGFTFEPGPVRAQGHAAEFQTYVGGDVEWTVTGPDGTKFNADYLAIGDDNKVILGDAKYTGTNKHEKSGHIAHLDTKVGPVRRMVRLAMMSGGEMQVGIVTNSPSWAPDSRVASDAYNPLPGNVAEDMMARSKPRRGAPPEVAKLREEVRSRLEDRIRELVDVDVVVGWSPEKKSKRKR